MSKIYKARIYFSIINDLLVRVIDVDKALGVAMVKHHEKDIEQDEVDFDDLIAVGQDEVNHYLGR
jgi:hypothetical protein